MLKADDTVLVFIDVQGRLHETMHDRDHLDLHLERMVRGCILMDIPVMVTEQIPGKLGPTSEPFRSLLQEYAAIEKTAFSCCGDLKFLSQLRILGRRQAVLVGIEAHVCVYQTAMDLLAAAYGVVVVADAVASRSAMNKSLALAAMRDAGARVLPAETVLFGLLRDAADPRFKELLNLIK